MKCRRCEEYLLEKSKVDITDAGNIYVVCRCGYRTWAGWSSTYVKENKA